MNILHSLPREDGFYMPAEFEPHEGCFLIWPERPDSWAGGAYAARKACHLRHRAVGEGDRFRLL